MIKLTCLKLTLASVSVAFLAFDAYAVSSVASNGDSLKGRLIYTQRCAMCHSLEAGKAMIGPSLARVAGRKIGSERYAYSVAMRAARFNWNARALSAFLKAPQQKIPGTKMTAKLSNPADRADVVAFLTVGH